MGEGDDGVMGAVSPRALRELLLSVRPGAPGRGRPAGEEDSAVEVDSLGLGEPVLLSASSSSSGSNTLGAVVDANLAIHSSSLSRF